MMTASITLALALPAAAHTATHKPVHIPGRKGDQSWQWNYRAWMPAHWIRLAQCESGSRGEPNWRHDSGTYEGAFGFYHGSWDQYKPVAWWPNSAANATPWQQFVVARRIAARFGLASPWGCWRGPQHAWVRGGLPEHGTYR